MATAERPLFLWWLATRRPLPDEMWFDVHMDGIPGDQPPPDLSTITTDPAMQRMWWYQTAKRCDVITRWGATYQIIELRHTSGPQTLGELQLYKTLSLGEWPTLAWRAPLLITERIDETLRRAIRAAGFPIDTPYDLASA
jgi:hypothetical protein